MGCYETTLKVRFAQVDYAGIMFYPRFFENFHAVFEDMFTDRLGRPYTELLGERRIGFPTVHLETEFRQPFRFGETMRLVLDVVHVGHTSITFRYRGYRESRPASGEAPVEGEVGTPEPAVEAKGTVVVLDLDSFETIPIPDDIRQVVEDLRAEDT